MSVEFVDANLLAFRDDDLEYKVLQTVTGDLLCCSSMYLAKADSTIDVKDLIYILQSKRYVPVERISVLYPDETVNYTIPNNHIIQDGIEYTENYVNGSRRTLQLKLVNVSTINDSNIEYPYMPDVNGLWFGTKIKYEQGIKYDNLEYYFPKGIYTINNFDLQHNFSARDITYQCVDKFQLFEGPTGILNDGYEVPVDTPCNEVLDGILNMSNSDGYVNDIKNCIVDSRYINWRTQATIRVDAGGTISDIIDQLATQMSAEYYYNTVGNLFLYPNNESMNDINKPIIWSYDESDISGLRYSSQDDIVNVVKVTGNNIDGKIYTATAKNTKLSSSVNIYRVKERKLPPITSPNIVSDEMAQELADFNLRGKTILSTKQTLDLLYNPLLFVNNIVEITNQDLKMHRDRYIINSITRTSGGAMISVEVSNLNNLPSVGGINYHGQ